jgi:NAD(P)-dependent dehydrogenase (short-subunit alcohol dehydrogenase family)
VLAAPKGDLVRALDGYLLAHFLVARAVIPALQEWGGSYTFINGPLAFEPMFPGTGIVSVATAAQSMLTRVLAKELEGSRVRVNELVIYSSFGWGRDDQNAVTGEDIGRYVAYLISERGAAVRGQTIHLKSPQQLEGLVP